MATYTATVTLPLGASIPIAPKMRFLFGSVLINPYSQTRAGFPITAIQNAFENSAPNVIGATSDLGFATQWDPVNFNFKCYGSNGAAPAALAEAAEGANVGNIQFCAFGY